MDKNPYQTPQSQPEKEVSTSISVFLKLILALLVIFLGLIGLLMSACGAWFTWSIVTETFGYRDKELYIISTSSLLLGSFLVVCCFQILKKWF